LEERSQAMKKEEKTYQKAAYSYGKALYESLPDSVHAGQIGQKAISLMDQITLHRSRIRKLEGDIKTLQNLIKVQELEAQIELENQKIDHLQAQIETFNRQIAQVHASIQLKQNKISELLPKKEPESNG
jgi:predicted  nucleic acid-binding Zn-ribbon protein